MMWVMNPSFPKDKSKAVQLTKEQFAIVHDRLIESMNGGKKLKDAEVIKTLEAAGQPINFGESK